MKTKELFTIGKVIYPYSDNHYSVPLVIREFVAKEFNIEVSDITGRCRDRNIVTARHLLHAIIYHLVQKKRIKCMTLRLIGDLTCRNHATVIHSVRLVADSNGDYRRELRGHWDRIVGKFQVKEEKPVETCVCCGREEEEKICFSV